jgi:hypothetical protein
MNERQKMTRGVAANILRSMDASNIIVNSLREEFEEGVTDGEIFLAVELANVRVEIADRTVEQDLARTHRLVIGLGRALADSVHRSSGTFVMTEHLREALAAFESGVVRT